MGVGGCERERDLVRKRKIYRYIVRYSEIDRVRDLEREREREREREECHFCFFLCYCLFHLKE